MSGKHLRGCRRGLAVAAGTVWCLLQWAAPPTSWPFARTLAVPPLYVARVAPAVPIAVRGPCSSPARASDKGTGSAVAAAVGLACAAALASRRPTGATTLFGKGGKGGSKEKGAAKGKKKKGGDAGGGAQVDAAGAGAAASAGTSEVDGLIEDCHDKMGKSVELCKEGMMDIKVGRASPSMVEGIKVRAYERLCPLVEVASVSPTDARTLLIAVFDEELVDAVAGALGASAMGFSPSIKDKEIRIQLPQMTTDQRQKFVALAKDTQEKSKLAVKKVREASRKKVQQWQKKKTLSEDEVKDALAELDDLTKSYNAKIETLFKAKEKNINTV